MQRGNDVEKTEFQPRQKMSCCLRLANLDGSNSDEADAVFKIPTSKMCTRQGHEDYDLTPIPFCLEDVIAVVTHYRASRSPRRDNIYQRELAEKDATKAVGSQTARKDC